MNSIRRLPLSEAKKQSELEYWKDQIGRDFSERYRKLLELWAVPGDLGEILEIGPGPRGGVLPFVDGCRKVGLDPLYEDYRASGLLETHPGVEYWTGSIEDYESEDRFNTVLSANSLDHGESDFRSLGKIAELLKPGGRLFLHVHLRTLEQLNIAHDHMLTLEHYEENLDDFQEEWRHLYERDPLDPELDPYRTLISCLKKPESLILLCGEEFCDPSQ